MWMVSCCADGWRPLAVPTLSVMLSKVLHCIDTCLSCRKRAGPNAGAMLLMTGVVCAHSHRVPQM
eukprot:1545441-Alexandrium_andersonii.AAC.1